MNREEIENKIKKIIASILSIDEQKIGDQSDFVHDLCADELDCVEIVMEVEDVFNIEILNEEAEKSTNITLLVDLVKGKLEE